MSENIGVRTVTVDDAEELLSIYRPYVERTAITFEYEVPTVEEFRRRIEHTLERYPYLAAVSRAASETHEAVADTSKEHGQCAASSRERILGYAYAGSFKERDAYDWSVETSIYVKMGLGRHGLGRLLYGKLEEILKAQGIINLNACIGVPQEAEDPDSTGRQDAAGDPDSTGRQDAAGDPDSTRYPACPEYGDEYLTNNSEMFHAHMGYHLVGRFHRCGYKFGRWYDMVWMEKMLSDHPECPHPVVPFPQIRGRWMP